MLALNYLAIATNSTDKALNSFADYFSFTFTHKDISSHILYLDGVSLPTVYVVAIIVFQDQNLFVQG